MTFSNVIRFDVIDSTNRYVAEQAQKGAPEGLVAVADEQRSGRGRLGRAWVANKGEALLCSLLFRPPLRLNETFVIPMLVSLAASDAARDLARVTIGCKWPNDLVYADRKLGGVLAEFVDAPDGRRPALIVGLGVNLFWSAESAPRASLEDVAIEPIGLAEVAGRAITRDELLATLLAKIDDRYAMVTSADAPVAIVREYAERCETIGRLVRVTTASSTFSGRAVAIAADGRLLVEGDKGTVRLEAADVVHVRER
jgi:BirA family transcriptional regulator, biotin operon repressor / biotin---[acetyl-CoA-carboxylase] ligase